MKSLPWDIEEFKVQEKYELKISRYSKYKKSMNWIIAREFVKLKNPNEKHLLNCSLIDELKIYSIWGWFQINNDRTIL